MKVYYLDDIGEQVFNADTTFIPRAGDTVSFDNENIYDVTDVCWYPSKESVVVTVKEQGYTKPAQKEPDLPGRLNEMQRAIMSTNKRVDAAEKKNRNLNEQLVSVRTHIRNQSKPKLKPE